MPYLRLDKYLADAGIGSRSLVKQYIRQKLVTVNGETVMAGELKIQPDQDIICYRGTPVFREEFVYYILNKPAGYVSATEDNTCQTVLALIQDPTHSDLFPVGRLDKDTEGLLLITNDGALAHRLLSPNYHVDKIYYVEVAEPIPSNAVLLFQEGIEIGEKQPTLPAKLEILSPTSANITIHEGKFHQIKRMFHAVGCDVTYLKRIAFGPLTLPDDLPLGTYRTLEKEALAELQLSAAIKRKK